MGLTVSSLLRGVMFLGFGALAGCATHSNPQYASLGGSTSGSGRHFDPRVYGVSASPRVVADGEEVPAGGGRYHVGKPYQIAGKTYYPSERPITQTGTASWYGSDFHGRRTANGEIFDRHSISAAHPTMPLPSYARVTNLVNSRSMVVRVNDRGPYHGGRVMDVSQRVADALDFQSAGTARVKVEWIGRANLAGDDNNSLLATLRDDGPASLPGAPAPVMTAEQEEPAPVRNTARTMRGKTAAPEESGTKLASRDGGKEPDAAEYQATAYAPDERWGQTTTVAVTRQDEQPLRPSPLEETAAAASPGLEPGADIGQR